MTALRWQGDRYGLTRMTAGDPRTPTPDGHATCPRCEQKARTA